MTDIKTILVCLKRVADYNVRVRPRSDGSGMALDGVKMSINPFDEIALEEALRIRERSEAREIVVVSIGKESCQQQLRSGLAMGADRAILIETEEQLEPLVVAQTLRALIDRENPQLVMMGKQAVDADNNQTGQMLAAMWNRPQATFVSELSFADGVATTAREVDAGLEVVEIELPAVITSDLRLNQPRYVKLPEIMRAKKKPLETLSLADLGIELTTQFRVVETQPPPDRPKGVMVADVAALVRALREKGLV